MTIILFCDMFIGKEGVLVSFIQDGTGDGPRLRGRVGGKFQICNA